MEKSLNETTRRNAIQQLILAAAGVSFLSVTSCKKDDAIIAPERVLSPFYLPPLAPLLPLKNGQNVRTWIRSNQMNIKFTSSEFVLVSKKMGPPPHFHKLMDELSFVLEGTVSFVHKDEIIDVPAGGWIMSPRNHEHTFFNKTDTQARMMNMAFGQNFEDYLEEIWLRIIPDMLAAGLTQADPGVAKKISDLEMKFDIISFPQKRGLLIAKYGLKP
jgi:mannose-6-phosphate isomerase-like protein (cupin superfamily)